MFRELRNKVYGAKIDGFMGKARGKVYSKSKESEKSLQELYIERYDSLKRQGFSRDYIVSLIGLSPIEKAKKAVNTNVAKTNVAKTSTSNKIKSNEENIKKAANETIEKARIVVRQYNAEERIKEARKAEERARQKELEKYKKIAEEKAAKLAEKEFDSKNRIEARKAAAEERIKEARKAEERARQKELEKYKKIAEEKAAELAEKEFDSKNRIEARKAAAEEEVDVDNLTENENKKLNNFCNMLYRSLEKFYGITEDEKLEIITDFAAKKLKNIITVKNYQARKDLVLEFVTEIISNYKLKTKEELMEGLDDLTLALNYCNTLQDKNETANDYTVTDFLNDVAKGKETIVK